MLVAHNSLLHFLGSAGQLGLALATYDGMRARGPAPDVVTCEPRRRRFAALPLCR
jgi:pentatricopeptide repeat protein